MKNIRGPSPSSIYHKLYDDGTIFELVLYKMMGSHLEFHTANIDFSGHRQLIEKIHFIPGSNTFDGNVIETAYSYNPMSYSSEYQKFRDECHNCLIVMYVIKS